MNTKNPFWRLISLSFVMLLLAGPFYIPAARIEVKSSAQSITKFPPFVLPYDKALNGKILWTGGPHSYSAGGQLNAKVNATTANGLDFAREGNRSFDVLSMSEGYVIRNRCGYASLGCIVAVWHDYGGSILIYAHLQPNRGATAPLNDLQEGDYLAQGQLIGAAGNSGNQKYTHLHIELRDGRKCADKKECGDLGDEIGNPISWDGRKFVDGYYINAYFVQEGCDPPNCRVYNYEGTAVNASKSYSYPNFPFKDNGAPSKALVFVADDFSCSSTTDCENNYKSRLTLFAGKGIFGQGKPLLSSNELFSPNG